MNIKLFNQTLVTNLSDTQRIPVSESNVQANNITWASLKLLIKDYVKSWLYGSAVTSSLSTDKIPVLRGSDDKYITVENMIPVGLIKQECEITGYAPTIDIPIPAKALVTCVTVSNESGSTFNFNNLQLISDEKTTDIVSESTEVLNNSGIDYTLNQSSLAAQTVRIGNSTTSTLIVSVTYIKNYRSI